MSFKSLRPLAWVGTAVLSLALAACGGGGGGGGGGGFVLPAAWGGSATAQTPPATSTGSSGTTSPTPAATASATLDVRGGTGASTTSLTALEIGQAVAVVKDASGNPVSGTIVKFAETGGSLLTISPAAATALTDASGRATVEIRAASVSSLGATTITAAATVGTTPVTAQKSIAISSAPAASAVSPQLAAKAINFLDTNPADKSIVIKGAGGNGRSESATLRFRVVDANNSPVKGVLVNFAVNGTGVTLNVPTATSDTDGVVVTTVSSGSVATVVVVQATVNGSNAVTTQSDQLTVTTGTATQAGFDLSATKYNLNYRQSGDKSTITVRIADANGNPVADGVPVVFTSDFLAVGSSSRGGCVTAGGLCTVDLVVQDPRPADGQYVTVTASTRVGSGTSISKAVRFTANDVSLVSLYTGPTAASTTQVTAFTVSAAQCNTVQVLSLFAGTPAAFPPPAGTAVSVTSSNPTLTAALASQATIDDVLSDPRVRTRVDLRFTPTTASCTVGATSLVDVSFTAGNGIKSTSTIAVTTVP